MSQLEKAIEVLKNLNSDNLPLESVLQDLSAINRHRYHGDVVELRKKLKQLFVQTKQCVFADCLIAIAAEDPINLECPILGDKIKPENRVCTSAGHQFDIYELVKFHNNRPLRIGEHESGKKFINPYTNEPFEPYDERHIRRIAACKNIEGFAVRRDTTPSTFTTPSSGKHPFFQSSRTDLLQSASLSVTQTIGPLMGLASVIPTWFK
jgi:hypothetical protein